MTWGIFKHLSIASRTAGNDVPDALLASLAMRHGATFITNGPGATSGSPVSPVDCSHRHPEGPAAAHGSPIRACTPRRFRTMVARALNHRRRPAAASPRARAPRRPAPRGGPPRQAALARCRIAFDYCSKPVPVGPDPAWASRPQVLLDGRALFPEIALLVLFQKAGWKGVWVDGTHRRYFDKMPNVSKGAGLDTRIASLLARVNAAAAGRRDLLLGPRALGPARPCSSSTWCPGPSHPGTPGSRGSTRRCAAGSPWASSWWCEWGTRTVQARKRPAARSSAFADREVIRA